MYETEAGSGEYQVTSDTTWPQEGYVFNEQLSACENGSSLIWDDATGAVSLTTDISDKCYLYFDVYAPNFAEYIKTEVYTGVDGENGLYYHDGVGSYTNADQEARDNSYRYVGSNPNNYVCFGSDEEICPSDNLYRIIGVFGNQVKLIKSTRAVNTLLGTDGSYAVSYMYDWNNSTNVNTWSESNLNTVNLNTNYLNNIGSTWSSKIAQHTWEVGGNTWENLGRTSVKTAYINEIKSPASATTYSAKVGLMYVSDYGYAVSPESWTTALNSYGNLALESSNWLYASITEWTITRNSDGTDRAFSIITIGNVDCSIVNSGVSVRPSFYLNSDVVLSGGSGSSADPYRIA